MYHRTFTWGHSKSRLYFRDIWVDRLWVLGFLLAAIILFGINLGGLPLQDGLESTIAIVTRKLSQTPISWQWLYATFGPEPYINHPPLLNLLIAAVYSIGGVNEWTTRLPGAMLTAISVPFLYAIGREIFPVRTPAIFATLIYLTLLPVVRQGRMAILDGVMLCFFLSMMLCVLRSRRDLRWGLGIGLGFGLICLTKGIWGCLFAAIALIFIIWDTPRLLTSGYLWTGILLGSAPLIAWYTAQWLHYGQKFVSWPAINIQLSWQKILLLVGNYLKRFWYYPIELLKYSWPWLLFLPSGWKLVIENRNLGWAKFVLVWTIVYLVVLSSIGIKSWNILPIYPALALVGGAYLAELVKLPNSKSYPQIWVICLGILGTIAFVGSLYFGGVGGKIDWYLHLVMMFSALTLLVAAILVAQKDKQFIAILFWGTYVSLVVFMASPYWLWELAQAYPVQPVAEILNALTPQGQVIYTSFPYSRSSLNFYSDRQIIPVSNLKLKQYWQQEHSPYLLVDEKTLKQLSLNQVKSLGAIAIPAAKPIKWSLITRQGTGNREQGTGNREQ